MSLTDKELQDAKNNIYKRLDDWVEEAKKKDQRYENGIQRLVSKFPTAMVRYRTKAQDGCHFIPVTKSYEERLRSIFINSMSCVPPVIGECRRHYPSDPQAYVPVSFSEEKYLPPLFLERRNTTSDNTIGTTSRQGNRSKSRQQNSRKCRHKESRQGARGVDSKTGLEFLAGTSPISPYDDYDANEKIHEIQDIFLRVPCHYFKSPGSGKNDDEADDTMAEEINKLNLSMFEAKFRQGVHIWKSKMKHKPGDPIKSSVGLKIEENPVQIEKEKRKSIGKDGKLREKRQQRKASRLRRMTILEEKYIKIRATPFRRFCRMIYHIVALFRVTSRQLKKEEKKNTVFERVGTDGELLTFDPQDYRSASKTYGGLTRMARIALAKRQNERNDVDIMVLLEVINRMPFFQKYSMSIKRDLAKCLDYDKIDAGRVVIRQDHPGFRMYFVSSGCLGVRMQMMDPRTVTQCVLFCPFVRMGFVDTNCTLLGFILGEKIVRQIKEFTPGCYFGELALMRNIKRTATVYCKTNCELLSMTKDSFNKVLRDAWDYLRAERLEILKQSVYFQTWEPQQLEGLADVTELCDYPDNCTITGDHPGLSEYVYFITKGNCVVVRRIQMIRQKSPHLESTLHLPEDACGPSFFRKNYGRYWRKQTHEYRFATMFILQTGDYFGVGENLTNTFVISKGKAQCLRVNSVQFEIQTHTEDLVKMAEVREPMLVSNQYLYSTLMATKAWNKYKKELVEEIASKRKVPTTTKMEDVPLSIRVAPQVLPN
ncbi:hypothetical protein LOTGIDRAFT_165029 [Lottia gigantea]|uniref:Cyclic nucleotide-binding domain-containing protein n=1 Tax=Lottia gigantea TaxID=225164 RepID=V3ZYH7_LOTGI|nr:hypothetical protein LOTGIDRAFT_165029 [Lottia gigantea]ESO89432.1 hypothetical protein LOTGIDRAFT_165029 [Lottia gigantea]